MGTDNDNSNINPFVDALRGNKPLENSEAEHKERSSRPEMVAATMNAMSMGDEKIEPLANGFASNESHQALENQPATTPDGGRMEAVVDLLFGSHLTDINANIRALEKQLSERVSKMESEMLVRIESIDRNTKSELESLNKKVEQNRAAQEEVNTKVEDQVESALQQVDLRIEKMESEFAHSYEMAQKDLNERLASAADASMLIQENMEQEIANMKITLSSRAELSTMFTELGKRLEANASGGGL